MNQNSHRNTAFETLASLYDALTLPWQKDVASLIGRATSPGWQSFSLDGLSKGRDQFIEQVKGFGKGIPDLKFEVKEVIVAQNRVIVRSEVTGTPAGPFMGVPHSGKSFKIMAIDIHTVENGVSTSVYHVEDWMAAVRQLS